MNADRILPSVAGLMFIGDPHLEARTPGFRRDDYPQVAITKFRWCLQYASQHQLQPILLGDLFQLPQDNPNWLLSAVIESIDEPLPAIYGNHDVRENTLKPNDSIHILFAGGHLQQISADDPWVGIVAGKKTVVGGTVWGEALPSKYSINEPDRALTVWATHHDVLIPGYVEAGRFRPTELPGIDLVVNGHVHRRLAPVRKGKTLWVTAGNITRRSRSDAARTHIPAVPCLYPRNAAVDDQKPVATFEFDTQSGDHWQLRWIEVPHQPFDDVFHPEMETQNSDDPQGSGFIADLRELTARRTDTGAGLTAFLNQHVKQFAPAVAAEILRLADEVTSVDSTTRDE